MLRISPQIQGVRTLRPTHLGRLLGLLDRMEREPLRIILNLPPRHSKTETLLHMMARRLRRRPWDKLIYSTFDANLSFRKSVSCREYFQRAGGLLRGDAASVQAWLTPEMGGAIWTSIGGGVTGEGCNVLVVDDPHKDRAEAESALHRDRVWNWFVGTAIDRVEVGGSIIICQTRWHPDDLTGRLLVERPQDNWQVVSLPAIGSWLDDGSRQACDPALKPGDMLTDDALTALWPERWTKQALLAKFAGDYEWLSKYQQDPQKRGGNVFKGVRYYNPNEVALDGAEIGIGLDLAYSEKTHAHYSAIVVLARIGPHVYVLYAQREQMEVPQFAEIVRGVCEQYPGSKVVWHTSTTEAGTAQLMRSLGIPVKNVLASADKFIRAQPVAAAWNLGNVWVPSATERYGVVTPAPAWVAPFVKEVGAFTGLGDKEDDQIDAFGSAYSKWAMGAKTRTDTDETDYSYG